MRILSAIIGAVMLIASFIPKLLRVPLDYWNDHSIVITEPGIRSLGTFRITAYTPYSDNGAWGYATATGVRSQHLATCAVDPAVIPLGSVIEVNGLRLKAVDIGGGVKGKIIDVFYDGTDRQAQSWLNRFGESHEVRLIK